jgi:hypothetical protein
MTRRGVRNIETELDFGCKTVSGPAEYEGKKLRSGLAPL